MRNHGTAIWQGFDFHWLRTPHRLNGIGSWLEGLKTEPDGPRGQCHTRLSVGRVPDRGAVRTWLAGVRSQNLYFIEGSVEAEVSAEVGEAAVVDAPRVEVPLNGADPASSTVVLQGFDATCLSHPAGTHPQGFGVRLKQIQARDGWLSFIPELYLHANHSPDPLTSWRGAYRYQMRAMYTVILGGRGAAAITHGAAGRPCVTLQHAQDRPSLLPRILQGQEGFQNGVIGLRGFRFDQLHRGRWRRDGRYLRRFHAYIGDASYDPRRGRLTWLPHAWFSNAGMVSYPMQAEHRLWTTLVQYRDPRPVLQGVLQSDVQTGLGEARRHAPFHLRGEGERKAIA